MGVVAVGVPNAFRSGAASGALAGLAGGLVFGAAMTQFRMLETVASIFRSESTVVGLFGHLTIAAVIGAGFGVLVRHQRPGVGETLFWGLSYGALWWFVGPLALMPLVLGRPLAWDVPSVQGAFPSLLGHLWYGASVGLVFAALQGRLYLRAHGPSRGAILRGALAGSASAWLVGPLIGSQGPLGSWTLASVDSPAGLWVGGLALGLLAGIGLAVLYPRPTDGAGPGLVRGAVYGFFCWVAGPLTLMPLLSGAGLPWSLDAARPHFSALIGLLLFGAAAALLYGWLDAFARLFLGDVVLSRDEEGIGIQSLRAAARGMVGGLLGGLVFTLVMVQIGFLPMVASLIGSSSITTGFLVHLGIALFVGASYGLLFRGRSFDLGSGLGWGVCYGFFWWVLGALTLMPLLLGGPPGWTVGVAAGLTASLVGHLAYGASLGITFHLLEARYSPWWIPLGQAQAARALGRQEQVLTSAPALWVMVAVIALTLPIVLAP